MIYFLHGDNLVLSRNKYNQLISQAKLEKKEIISIEGKTVTLTKLIQSLESSSLFGHDKLIFIENLFTRQKSKEKDNITKYLKNEKISPDIIFWEKKEISGKTLRWLPKNWQYQLFKTPVIIFKLLDSIKPNNNQQTINLLHQCLKLNQPDMIFYMIIRQIRLLVLAKELGKKGIKAAPWQIAKLLKQANNFTIKQLTNIYKKLLKIDISIKTGKSLMPLDWHLDLLVLSL